MQLDFVLKHTQAKGSDVKPFLEDKTQKLEKYSQGDLHAKWTISFENDLHIAHLHVTGGNSEDYFGEATEHNLFSAIEEAVEKVERQLKKHKEKLKDHHK